MGVTMHYDNPFQYIFDSIKHGIISANRLFLKHVFLPSLILVVFVLFLNPEIIRQIDERNLLSHPLFICALVLFMMVQYVITVVMRLLYAKAALISYQPGISSIFSPSGFFTIVASDTIKSLLGFATMLPLIIMGTELRHLYTSNLAFYAWRATIFYALFLMFAVMYLNLRFGFYLFCFFDKKDSIFRLYKRSWELTKNHLPYLFLFYTFCFVVINGIVVVSLTLFTLLMPYVTSINIIRVEFALLIALYLYIALVFFCSKAHIYTQLVEFEHSRST